MYKKRYWIGLSMLEGLGPVFINKLLKKYGSPEKIWKLKIEKFKKINGIGPKRAKKIYKTRKSINLNNEIKKLKNKDIKFITLADKDFPELLKNIYDPPPVIYYKGNEIFSKIGIAIVGSRRCTVYGRNTALKLASKLANRGITIVSGMARGIDSAGHKGALRANGKTIAVLGSGLDCIYPPENNKLYDEITKKGAVISEFPPGTKPKAKNFPRRNRIISGLCRGVIVVEAAQRSGSLITANLALEQGRDVFAVPGNIDRSQSQGTNNLIKEGALMVTSYNDILEELFLYKECNDQTEKNLYPELNKNEKILLRLFKKEPELSFDKLYENTNLSKNILSSCLLKMELKGLISLKPGKKYVFKGLQNLLKPL